MFSSFSRFIKLWFWILIWVGILVYIGKGIYTNYSTKKIDDLLWINRSGNVYYTTIFGIGNKKNLFTADFDTFMKVDEENNKYSPYYYRDQDHVYMVRSRDQWDMALRLEWWIIEWADPSTFSILPYWFTKDKSSVYSIGSDSQAHLIPGLNPDKLTIYSFSTIKDDKNVYVSNLNGFKILEWSDAWSYKETIIGNQIVSEDANNIYMNGIWYDKNTIRMIGHGYYLQGDLIYYGVMHDNIRIPQGVDKSSLEYIGTFFRDKKHVYKIEKNDFKVVEWADAATFEKLGFSSFAKDKENVYYISLEDSKVYTLMWVSDISSLEFVTESGQTIPSYARDKNLTYSLCTKYRWAIDGPPEIPSWMSDAFCIPRWIRVNLLKL